MRGQIPRWNGQREVPEIQAGTATVSIPVNTQSGTVAVTFPVPFEDPPIVVVSANINTIIAANVTSVSTTGCTVRAMWVDTNPTGHSASSIPVNWIAYA